MDDARHELTFFKWPMGVLGSTKNRLYLLLSFLVGLTGLTYYHRNPTSDDAWFAEQSYWFYKDGIIRSEFFRGFLGWDKQLLVSHKLFLIIGAGLIRIFGIHPPVLQLVGLLFFGCLLAGVIVYIRKSDSQSAHWYVLAALVLIFSNRLLIRMSFENRPEMVLAALGFWSFLCLYFNRNQYWKTALAGLLAGTALLCHLNGVIFLMAGAATLLYLRQYRQAVVFSIIGGLTGLTYFIDVIQAQNGFSVWYYQFRNDPATQNAFGFWSKFLVLVTYPKLFFVPLENLALSLLLGAVLWHQRKLTPKVPLVLRVYVGCLFIAFWLITKRNSSLYMLLFIPFMLTLLYELYRIKPFTTIALKGIVILYFVIGIYGTGQLIYKNLSIDYAPQAYSKLREHIPAGKTGLVPLTFFFNEYEQYPRLLCYDNFIYGDTHTGDSAGEIAKWAYKKRVGFMLFDYKYQKEYVNPAPNRKQLPFYTLSFYDGRFAVYTRPE